MYASESVIMAVRFGVHQADLFVVVFLANDFYLIDSNSNKINDDDILPGLPRRDLTVTFCGLSTDSQHDCCP